MLSNVLYPVIQASSLSLATDRGTAPSTQRRPGWQTQAQGHVKVNNEREYFGSRDNSPIIVYCSSPPSSSPLLYSLSLFVLPVLSCLALRSLLSSS